MIRQVSTSLGHSAGIDRTGAVGPIRKGQVPPTHLKNKAAARNLGRQVMADFKRRSPQEQQANIEKLKGSADAAERIGVRSGALPPPATHKRKVDNFLENPSGKKFREITKNQDELTQSERTTSFVKGMQDHSKSFASGSRTNEHEFQRQSTRLMSSMRAPTDTVSAPLDVGGRRVGMRHPTNAQAVPSWAGANSAHSDADRRRADLVNTSGLNQLNKGGPEAPAKAVLAQAHEGGRYTLQSMSLPYQARNVHSTGFAPKGDQTKQREAVKEQVNGLSTDLGIPPQTRTQGKTDPALPYNEPTSPLRT